MQYTWVYACVSPSQKELILTSLKSLGYIMLIATVTVQMMLECLNVHIIVVLLNGTPDNLKKIAEHQRIECLTKVYETQL